MKHLSSQEVETVSGAGLLDGNGTGLPLPDVGGVIGGVIGGVGQIIGGVTGIVKSVLSLFGGFIKPR